MLCQLSIVTLYSFMFLLLGEIVDLGLRRSSRTCPNVETSNMLSPEPSSKLLNLMGFFSGLGGACEPTLELPVVEAIVKVVGVREGVAQEGGRA